MKIRLIIFSRLLKNEVALSHADNANIYFINGVLSQDEGKLKEAIGFFEEYFKYGNNLEAYVRIVKALEDIGDKEKYYYYNKILDEKLKSLNEK